MRFEFHCRKFLFWRSYLVIGFKYEKDLNRMILYFEDGSILELCEWSKYDCKLGQDYFDCIKKDMEQKAGQSIPTKEVR